MSKVYIGSTSVLGSTETVISPYTGQPISTRYGRTSLGSYPTGTSSIALYGWNYENRFRSGRSALSLFGIIKISDIPPYTDFSSGNNGFISIPSDLNGIFLSGPSTSSVAAYIALTHTDGTIYISAYEDNSQPGGDYPVICRPILWSASTMKIGSIRMYFLS